MKVEIEGIGLCEFNFTKMHVVGGKIISKDDSRIRKGGKTQISTMCMAIIPERPDDNSFGYAHQNPTDIYSKLVGKKVALTRVLNIIWPESMITKPLRESEISHHKKLRTLVWRKFWVEFGHLLEKV